MSIIKWNTSFIEANFVWKIMLVKFTFMLIKFSMINYESTLPAFSPLWHPFSLSKLFKSFIFQIVGIPSIPQMGGNSWGGGTSSWTESNTWSTILSQLCSGILNFLNYAQVFLIFSTMLRYSTFSQIWSYVWLIL